MEHPGPEEEGKGINGPYLLYQWELVKALSMKSPAMEACPKGLVEVAEVMVGLQACKSFHEGMELMEDL